MEDFSHWTLKNATESVSYAFTLPFGRFLALKVNLCVINNVALYVFVNHVSVTNNCNVRSSVELKMIFVAYNKNIYSLMNDKEIQTNI